jgi:acyl carrier protein|tara:strand:+ start:825 stop:1052 length:228 start_codon:yes stop_codon:yes gene_type:complete
MLIKSLDKKLKKIFLEELKIKVKNSSKIYDFKSWDSLGNFNILLRCEREFQIKFTSKEFTNLNSYKEIEKVVQKK